MTTLNGTNQADYLFGTPLADEIHGFGGKDILRGHLGDDVLYGHGGGDRLFGDAGNDFLYAGAGDDALDGGDGLDTLFGGLGADTLRGGAGDDLIELDNDDAFGGAGDDFLAALFADGRMTGGAGADRFRIRLAEGDDQHSIITDFTTGDTLDLEFTSAKAQIRLEGADLFARLDTDGDLFLTGADGFAEQPEGLFTGVQATGEDLRIWLAKDSVTLERVVAVTASDWT